MKKLLAILCVAISILSAVPAYASSNQENEPIIITQQEIHDNLKLLNADKQKYLFEIASFTDVKARDIALDKLRITVYLINEWKSHLN